MPDGVRNARHIHTNPVHNRPMDTEWFKKRMKEVRVTHAQLAHAINRDRSAVTRMLSGRRDFDLRFVTPFARELQVTPQEILARAGLDIADVDAGQFSALAEPPAQTFLPGPPPDEPELDHILTLMDLYPVFKGVLSTGGDPHPRENAYVLAQSAADALREGCRDPAERDRMIEFGVTLLKAYMEMHRR